jgi:hypothetical protein
VGSGDRVLFAGGQLWDTQAGRKAGDERAEVVWDPIALDKSRLAGAGQRSMGGIENEQGAWLGWEGNMDLSRTISFFLLHALQIL